MTEQFYDVPGVREARAALVPFGRVGLPEDIAKVVFFLASSDSEYMNGEFLRVDGGFTLTPSLNLYTTPKRP
jgi:glucose 1-dehydrogenase